MDIESFDSSGVGINNGHFIGLPFSEEDARIVIISVPWDVTVSYTEGTADAPENILNASLQLDLYKEDIPDAWKTGIFMRPSDENWVRLNEELRPDAFSYVDFLENGGDVQDSSEMQFFLNKINHSCSLLNEYVYQESIGILEQGKIPVVVGGEHSVPLGLIKGLHEKVGDFGILQIDAHMDLRCGYEGFTYSHASIFHNVLTHGYTKQLTQVGVRDFCDEEVAFAEEFGVKVFSDSKLKDAAYKGKSWHEQSVEIIATLPEKVYISFDIDGLNPHLCPGTGTPVPGGLEYAEATYLIKEIAKSGRQIIGFDLCEVGSDSDWDGNVGARILYELCCWTGR